MEHSTNHNTIVISASEYKDLVIIEERYKILEGLLRKNGYVNTGDMKVIFGIEETEGDDGEL